MHLRNRLPSHLLPIILFVLILSATGCTRTLSVRTAYLNRENLAAYFVGTPDPNLQKPLIGQRLIISWSLPKEFCRYKKYCLVVTVRMKNHEEETRRIPIRDRSGFYVFKVSDKKFIESGGILTYKTEIWGDDSPIASWLHPLWAELILFKDCDKPSGNKLNPPSPDKPCS